MGRVSVCPSATHSQKMSDLIESGKANQSEAAFVGASPGISYRTTKQIHVAPHVGR